MNMMKMIIAFYMAFAALWSGRYIPALRRNKPQIMIFIFYRENGGNILLRNPGTYLIGVYCSTSRKAIPVRPGKTLRVP
jgi:hypothetical protein